MLFLSCYKCFIKSSNSYHHIYVGITLKQMMFVVDIAYFFWNWLQISHTNNSWGGSGCSSRCGSQSEMCSQCRMSTIDLCHLHHEVFLSLLRSVHPSILLFCAIQLCLEWPWKSSLPPHSFQKEMLTLNYFLTRIPRKNQEPLPAPV